MLMLVCSAVRMNEGKTKRVFARPFILPEKVTRVEWLKSSSMDENINRNLKIIPALNNKFEIISFCYKRNTLHFWNKFSERSHKFETTSPTKIECLKLSRLFVSFKNSFTDTFMKVLKPKRLMLANNSNYKSSDPRRTSFSYFLFS